MDLSKRALGYGMDSYVVNGNDFFEVYDGMQRPQSVLAMARVIAVASLECQTHRPFGHIVGMDSATVIRHWQRLAGKRTTALRTLNAVA